jgi:uncharacterized peroxidase-related enzyme
MQILKSIDNASATGKTKQIFDSLQKHLGTVPNLVRVLANSPAAVNAYASFSGALDQGVLPAKTREQVAIAVATANSCDYCLSAHTALGQVAGLATDELKLAQKAESADKKTAAALQFAVNVVRKRGIVSPAEVEELRSVGYSDAEVVEIIAGVALNIFTNYFNNIVGTDIDFPVVHSR